MKKENLSLFLQPQKLLIAILLHKKFEWLCRMIPDKAYIRLLYRLMMGKTLDLKNPKLFTEKIQWLKLYDFKPEYTRMVDKLTVKDYVSSLICKEYVIPTIGVWDRVEDIDWDNLPNQFVLKTTHGGGGTGVVVCSDKSKLDKQKAIEKLMISMKANAGYTFREKPYIHVPRKIIAERFLPLHTIDGKVINKELPDYKFFCFDGEPKYCQVIRDRSSYETIDFYDMEWNHMPFVGLNPVAKNEDIPVAKNGDTPVPKPDQLPTLIKICKKLSDCTRFLRIDLYVIDDRVYFGEITFYPASGMGKFSPEEWNLKLGNLINISIENQRRTNA